MSDTRVFPYEEQQLRLVWDSNAPTQPALSIASSSPSPVPPGVLPPQPLPSGGPSQWPTFITPNSILQQPAIPQQPVVTPATPCLACIPLKAPMSDKLQKQLSSVEPIRDQDSPQSQRPSDASSTDQAQPKKRKPLVSMNSFSLTSSLSQDTGPPPTNILPLRPKANMRTTSSNFFLRVEPAHHSASGFTRMLSAAAAAQLATSRHPDTVTLAFWTQHKSLIWQQLPSDAAPLNLNSLNDAHPSSPPAIPKSVLSFAVPITAMALNQHSASHAAIDILIACGPDIMWIDPIATRYSRFNKTGIVTTSPVVKLAWCEATKEALARGHPAPTFLSAHADGSIIHWALDRDDPSASNVPHIPKFDTKWSPEEDLLPCTSQPPQSDSSSNKKVPAKPNPIIAWRVSKKTITDISVSPDPNNPGRYLAASSLDGALRIIDLVEQRLLDAYASYFGGLNCVCWSPDGHCVLTGGQDDLVSIYSVAEQRLLFRCQGHMSFVRSIGFEPAFEDAAKSMRPSLGASAAHLPPGTRFASVGEDGRLVLWDLAGVARHYRTPSTLQHATSPRHPHDESFTRLDLSSTLSLNTLHHRKATTNEDGLATTDSSDAPIWHAAPSRKQVALFKPIAVSVRPLDNTMLEFHRKLIKRANKSAVLAHDQLVDLAFLPSGCAVLTRSGALRVYLRPLPPPKS